LDKMSMQQQESHIKINNDIENRVGECS